MAQAVRELELTWEETVPGPRAKEGLLARGSDLGEQSGKGTWGEAIRGPPKLPDAKTTLPIEPSPQAFHQNGL